MAAEVDLRRACASVVSAPSTWAPLQPPRGKLGAPRTLASRARRGLHQLTACPATRAPLRRARRGVDRPPATTTASRKRRRIARASSLACASGAVDVTARRWLGGVVEVAHAEAAASARLHRSCRSCVRRSPALPRAPLGLRVSKLPHRPSAPAIENRVRRRTEEREVGHPFRRQLSPTHQQHQISRRR